MSLKKGLNDDYIKMGKTLLWVVFLAKKFC